MRQGNDTAELHPGVVFYLTDITSVRANTLKYPVHSAASLNLQDALQKENYRLVSGLKISLSLNPARAVTAHQSFNFVYGNLVIVTLNGVL